MALKDCVFGDILEVDIMLFGDLMIRMSMLFG